MSKAQPSDVYAIYVAYVQALQVLEHLGILLVSLRCLMMSF
jgi:hypothetical protein